MTIEVDFMDYSDKKWCLISNLINKSRDSPTQMSSLHEVLVFPDVADICLALLAIKSN